MKYMHGHKLTAATAAVDHCGTYVGLACLAEPSGPVEVCAPDTYERLARAAKLAVDVMGRRRMAELEVGASTCSHGCFVAVTVVRQADMACAAHGQPPARVLRFCVEKTRGMWRAVLRASVCERTEPKKRKAKSGVSRAPRLRLRSRRKA